MVCDEFGSTISDNGSSAGLGNATDLSLLIALRRQSQVIVTSGKTLRADDYRFPKFADLAVLTNSKVELSAPEGQKLLLDSTSYVGLVDRLLQSDYSRLHIEYGITGIKELIKHQRLSALYLSSKHIAGLEALATELQVTPAIIELDDLYVGLVAWQTASRAQ